MINALANIARTLISMGDVTQAATYAGRIEQLVDEARGSPNPSWRAAYGHLRTCMGGRVDNSVRGIMFDARGQYSEAEAAYRRSEAFRRASLKDLPRWDFPPPPEQIMQAVDTDGAGDRAQRGQAKPAERSRSRRASRVARDT